MLDALGWGVDAHFLCFQNVGLLLRAFHGVHWRAATSVKRHLRFRAGITLPKVTAEVRMLLQWTQAPPLHTKPPSGVPLTLTLSQVILPRVALALLRILSPGQMRPQQLHSNPPFP